MTGDLLPPPAPSSYEEAEAILQRLAPGRPDQVWDQMTQAELRTLLKNLAGASLFQGTRVGHATSTSDALPRSATVPAAPITESDEPGDSAWGQHDASESPRSLPRLSEKTLLNVLETAPDAMVVVDARGDIVLVNTQTEKMFGYDRLELLGKKVELLVPIRHRARHVHQRRDFFQAPHVRAMGSGLPLFGVRKDGSEFPVEISLSPLETEVGMLVTSAIRDVTEGKSREAQLRKAEARYRSLVEEIPAVTFMAALDEGINELYVSPQIVDLLGFTQEEWLNDPVLWHRQLHPEDRDRWHLEFARTCATAQPFRSVYRFLARDGRVVWVLGEAKVVRDRDGRPMFLQGVAFDITRMKNAEEELTLLNRTLDDRVQERTAALKRSNEELERYSDFVRHELKKPVRALFDELKGPLERLPARQAGQRLGRITQIATDMAKLIEEMFAYARVSEEVKRFAPTDSMALFREARAELQKDVKASSATISLSRLPIVNGHRESLRLVFRNLLDNAIKYRAKRRLKVRVSARLQDDDWLFSVSDNGVGIKKLIKYTNEDNWEKIFGLFHRDHTGSVPGHGIGLSYCRRVIEHHGGRIWVHSVFGKGSIFHFTLPAVHEGEKAG
jgi:PAS domain S-box-containing protein